MDLIINNEIELNKFYNKLRLYKIFNRKDQITIKSIKNINDQDLFQLNSIIKVFNCKNKNKRLELIYDEACLYLNKYYIDPNICEFKNNKCIYQRDKKTNNKDGCCKSNCSYLCNKRCTANSLSCKLYFCYYIRKKKKCPYVNDIKVLKYFFNIYQKLIIKCDIYINKEEELKRLKRI